MDATLYLGTSDLAVLKRAFPRADHEFVNGFVYLSEDAITNRIEEVDPAWTFDIQRMERVADQAIVCARLTIKSVAREGVGMQKVNEKAGEPDKGAATDALKRCARLFGIGRYLLDAPKEGEAFNTWLAGQQKRLGTVSAPEPATVEPSKSTSEPSAAVKGAGIVKPLQAEPEPPPVAYDELPDLGAPAETADAPNLYEVDALIVSVSKTAKQFALRLAKTGAVLHVADVGLLDGLFVGATPAQALQRASYPVDWVVKADRDAQGNWELREITVPGRRGGMSVRNPETIGDDPCYTAHKRCGCMVGAIVDKPERPRDVGKQLEKWYQQGLTIERAQVRDVWQSFVGWNCPHEPKQEAFL